MLETVIFNKKDLRPAVAVKGLASGSGLAARRFAGC
jgi:hypothetical protein